MATAEDKSETTALRRSPNYPYYNLQTAVQKIRTLYKEIGRHPVGIDVLVSRLGHTAKSSSGKKSLAALRAFGFIDDTKVGRDQLVKLSGRALDIAADYKEGESEWVQAVRAAARSPKIHGVVLDRYKGALPPDDELRRYLVRVYDPPFTDAGANDFIAELRSTLEFAQRYGSSVDTQKNGNAPEDLARKVQVGAYVQWTSQGIDRFPEPLKVAQIVTGPDGKEYAYVEGEYEGALPVEQLTVENAASTETPPVQLPPNPYFKRRQQLPPDELQEGFASERKKLDEGHAEIRWPDELSEDSYYELEHWLEGVLSRARRKAGIKQKKRDNAMKDKQQ